MSVSAPLWVHVSQRSKNQNFSKKWRWGRGPEEGAGRKGTKKLLKYMIRPCSDHPRRWAAPSFSRRPIFQIRSRWIGACLVERFSQLRNIYISSVHYFTVEQSLREPTDPHGNMRVSGLPLIGQLCRSVASISSHPQEFPIVLFFNLTVMLNLSHMLDGPII